MAHDGIRTAPDQSMIFLDCDDAAPVAAQIKPRPHGEADARKHQGKARISNRRRSGKEGTGEPSELKVFRESDNYGQRPERRHPQARTRGFSADSGLGRESADDPDRAQRKPGVQNEGLDVQWHGVMDLDLIQSGLITSYATRRTQHSVLHAA